MKQSMNKYENNSILLLDTSHVCVFRVLKKIDFMKLFCFLLKWKWFGNYLSKFMARSRDSKKSKYSIKNMKIRVFNERDKLYIYIYILTLFDDWKWVSRIECRFFLIIIKDLMQLYCFLLKWYWFVNYRCPSSW